MSNKQPIQDSSTQGIAKLPHSCVDREVDQEMSERRTYIRGIPCPHAIESDDPEVWADWDQLSNL
jgi:hypothetical protein